MTRHGNRKGARRSKEAARLPDSKEEEKEEEEEAKQQRSRLYTKGNARGYRALFTKMPAARLALAS